MSSNLKVNNILPSTGDTVAVSGIASVTSSVSIASSCTAATFYGNGANLTGLSGVSVANQADNRLITATGTTDALNGEANLTFDGNNIILAGNDGRRFSFAGGGTSHYMKYDNTLGGIILNGYGGITFETNGTNERLRIDSAGRIGIGENNPTRDVVIKKSGSVQVSLVGATNQNVFLNFGDTDDDNIGGINYDNTNNRLRFRANTNDAVQVKSNGNMAINDGDLEIGTSGHGISFAATGNISGTSSELLDDYEEGSWTPVVQGWDTFTPYSGSSYYQGWYVKVGGMVHCGWKIYIQHLTTPSSNAHVRIHGLPFTSRSVAAGPVAVMRFDIVETGITNNQWNYMGGNSNTIYLYKQTNGGNGANAINASQNYSNMWTMGTATYATDS